jgi:hypothetical protein
MANAIRAIEVHPTATNLGAQPGPQVAHYATTLDQPRLYRWIDGSALYADGYVVLDHVGGFAGRWRQVVEDDRGADLTNANATIYLSGKPIRYLPASTLTAKRELTIGTNYDSDSDAAVCLDGDRMTIVRLDAGAYTYTIYDEALAPTTIITLPNSEQWFVDLRFDGSNWVLLRAGKMTP